MSDWISKAVNAFKRDTPVVSQPFEVFCQCGQEHFGLRRTQHQHLVCKTCGVSLFVLPKDAYPSANPKPKRRGEAKGVVPSSQTPASTIDAVLVAPDQGESGQERGRQPPELPKPRQTQRQVRRQIERAKDLSNAPVEPEGPSIAEVLTAKLASGWRNLRTGFWSFWTPFRSIALMGLLVVTVSIAWSVREALMSQSRRIASEASASGYEAAGRSDWIDARRHFEIAVASLDRLRRHDSEAERIRQSFKETRALTRLSTMSLFELADEARQSSPGASDEELDRLFASRHQGSWLVFDGLVQKAPAHLHESDSDRQQGYVIQFPWNVGGKESTILVEANFEAFEPLPKQEDAFPAIFAGELRSCRPDGEGRWRIVLAPETGFLWTGMNTYRALGFEFDDQRSQTAVQSQLDLQARITGISQ